MYNFDKFVNSVLTEQEPVPAADTTISNPQWVKNIVNKYNELYSSKGDSVREEDVAKLWPLVVKGYITDNEIISIGIERAKILDILKQIYATFSNKPKSFDELKKADEKTISSIIDKIKATKTPEAWNIEDGNVIRAYNIARAGADRASAVALETFNQSTIFNTIQEMVKRRTNAFDAISHLKSPTTPFKSLLQDIFKTPEQYLSGQKKITSDWNNIIDGLYVTAICNIALNTKDLFQSLVQPPKQETTNTVDKAAIARNVRANVDKSQAASKTSNFANFSQQPVNASLEYFSQLVEQVLLEQTSPVKDYTKDETAYNNFYINGTLPVDIPASKDENGKPVVYNIKKISELVTPEAQKLIASLRSIAHYEKAKPGAGERLAGAQQALQGVASFAGAKLYT